VVRIVAIATVLRLFKIRPNPVEIRPHPNDLFTVHINVILRSVRHSDCFTCIAEGRSQQPVCPSVVVE
jgi:hypothetical protein